MDYILDTNIVLTYLRNNQLARNLEQKLDLLSGQHNLIISVVSTDKDFAHLQGEFIQLLLIDLGLYK